MNALIQFFRPARTWNDLRPLSPSERMAQYSARHANEMRQRENESAGLPRVRLVDGKPVLVALPGRVNPLPKDAKASA